MPQTPSCIINLKQSITITGLSSKLFESSVQKMQCIYETFCLYASSLGGTLRKWTPGSDREDLVLTFSNYYLTSSKDASMDSILDPATTIDPFNVLGPYLNNTVYTLDNVVKC